MGVFGRARLNWRSILINMCKLKEILGSKSVFRKCVLAVILNYWQQHLNYPLQGFQNPLTEVRALRWPRIAIVRKQPDKSGGAEKKGVNNNDNKVVVWPAGTFLTRVMAAPAMTMLQQAHWWNSYGQLGQSWWKWLDNSINFHFIVSSCAAHGKYANDNDTSYYMWVSL